MIESEFKQVVIAEKNMFKGVMFASIANGNLNITISNGISLRFVALNEKFITVQVLNSGIGIEPKTQSWFKTKTQPKEKQLKIKTEQIKPVPLPESDLNIQQNKVEGELI